MPAAQSKADLIAVTEKDWAKLSKLLDGVPEEVARLQDDDRWSIKDVVAHRAHWIGLFFQWLDEGEAAETPDHGVKWNQLKPYNAAMREKYAHKSWAEARAWLTTEHERLLQFIESSDDAALYGDPMPGGNGKWTTGRFAEASGPSHYRSAAKFVRATLRRAREMSLV